jgi:hypothetical protein
MQVFLEERGILKQAFSERFACVWLDKLQWHYGKQKIEMYIDGHEGKDVVAYRKVFIERWKEYECRFQLFDDKRRVRLQ